MLGFPSELYVPMMSTGEGSKIVFAGSKSFIIKSSLIVLSVYIWMSNTDYKII
jgi:hypothetical protein